MSRSTVDTKNLNCYAYQVYIVSFKRLEYSEMASTETFNENGKQSGNTIERN